MISCQIHKNFFFFGFQHNSQETAVLDDEKHDGEIRIEKSLAVFEEKNNIKYLTLLADNTRPDVLFVVNYLARFTQKPLECHWTAIKQVIRYLISTTNLKIEYRKDSDGFNVYSDSDHAGPLNKRVTTSRVIINLGSGPIIYASRKQQSVAISSTEAEYIAAC